MSKRTPKPQPGQTVPVHFDADTWAWLCDCATANGGEPAEIAASMLREVVRDSVGSGA